MLFGESIAARISLWRRSGHSHVPIALLNGRAVGVLREFSRTVAGNYPSGTRRHVARWWSGWVAVAISTALSCFWATWGAIENFHEGWYYREWYRNVGLMLVQYAPWMLLPMGAALAALWRRWAGLLVHLGLAGGVIALVGAQSAGGRWIALPIAVLGLLHMSGTPAPKRWARTILVVAPLLTFVGSGAYPAWRVFTRSSAVELSTLHITRPGLDIVWAQAGPGWGYAVSWHEATRRCAFLNAEGTSLLTTPANLWRLPTTREAARSMTYRGRDAEGRWNEQTGRASFSVQPDKEAPLWHPHSHVIYLWTATERNPQFAYFIAYNGGTYTRRKDSHPDYQGYRCVTTPQ